ncbi:MAG: DNA methyltransferase [Bacteroidota bacterium]
MTPDAFIARWKEAQASERANYSLFLSELCDLLGAERPQPSGAVAASNTYAFERSVKLKGGTKATTGFIDLYKQGCFVLEAKQGSEAAVLTEAEKLTGQRIKRKMGTARRGTKDWRLAMQKAKAQAQRYARALPTADGWPPFLVVTDVGYCIDLYADFSGQGKAYLPFPDPRGFRIMLDDLRDEAVQDRLRLVWTDPMALDPARRSARVTRALAEKLARLAHGLEADGHSPDAVAQFLMRVLFTMFAEDVGLLPERSFTHLLEKSRQHLDVFADLLRDLWQTMDHGGFSSALMAKIPQFNGSLFAEADALPVSEAGLNLLVEAAQADWTDVEPAIFGTLLERALDPDERHKLGAHFTPRAYVERLVLPTIIEPLRAEWQAAQAASAALDAESEDLTGDKRIKQQQAARDEIVRFHRRLCSLKVLDPACGSGNFLYVTLEHLKRLEGEVLDVLDGFGGQQGLAMTGGYTVTPQQLLGLEINPRAAAIADVVLWIGYLQWHFRTYGDAQRLDPPILRAYKNIVCTDALLAEAEGGATVPAAWPEADFIIGNPPFLGKGEAMREALGDAYVETLRRTYKALPNSIDFVMYWWDKAAALVRTGQAERFGFIATNSLRQTFNRRVLTPHLEAEEPLSLAFAIPDHPWVDGADGADVRISMTVGMAGAQVGRLVTVTDERPADLHTEVTLNDQLGTMQADLTVGAEVSQAVGLQSGAKLHSNGMMLAGAGFLVSETVAKAWLAAGCSDQRLRPYRNGRDLTSTPRRVFAIDFYGLSPAEARTAEPVLFQHVVEHVKPSRDKNKNKKIREQWWLYARTRPMLRDALNGLERFIATVETSKHRFFQFLDASILPDHMLIAFALDDAYHLGVLSSRIHVTWALAAGGTLEDRPRYNKTVCFDPFPFPTATESQQVAIRQLGEELDAFRKARLAEHEKLTMTDLYNVLERLRAGIPPAEFSKKEQHIHEQGLVSVLKTLHDDLDDAVAAAYGWPADLTDEGILERLVALNAQRAEEEAQGIIRYLRPAYQAPEAVQTALPVEAPITPAADRDALRRAWPKTLAERAQAVLQVVTEAPEAVDAEAVAQHFHRAQRKQVVGLLDTLAALGQIQQLDATHFAG